MDSAITQAQSAYPIGHPDRIAFFKNFIDSLTEKVANLQISREKKDTLILQITSSVIGPPSHLAESTRSQDIQESILYLEDALKVLSDDHQLRSSIINDLGEAHWDLYRQSGHSESINKAISLHREALNIRKTDSDADRSTSHSNLGCALLSRFEHVRNSNDLEDSILNHTEALRLRPGPSINRFDSLTNLGAALWLRFDALGNLADLESAIIHHRAALSLPPQHYPTDPTTALTNLGSALWSLHQLHSHDLELLYECISLYEKAHESRPTGATAANLGVALRTRYQHFLDPNDLEKAIVCGMAALSFRPTGHPDRAVSLNNVALALCDAFSVSEDIELLNTAIEYHREALELRPQGNWDRPESLNDLGVVLRMRYEFLGAKEDLTASITYHRSALSLLNPLADRRRPRALANLGVVLLTVCQSVRNKETLDEVIQYLETAIALHSDHHTERFTSLNVLGCAFETRYTEFGAIADLEAAILHLQTAVECAKSPKDKSIALGNLSYGLRLRFMRFNTHDDLNHAVDLGRESLLLHTPSASILSNLAMALEAHFRCTGNVDDLTEAMSYHEKALTLCKPPSTQRHVFLGRYGSSLITHFHEGGSISSLNKAIEYYSEAYDTLLSTPSHINFASAAANFASGLESRYQRYGDSQDLHKAITFYEQAYSHRQEGHPGLASTLNNLGCALWRRSERTAQHDDIETAIEHLQKAHELASDNNSRVTSLCNLGTAFYTSYELKSLLEDLQRAFSCFSEAFGLCVDQRYQRPMCLDGLGIVHMFQFRRNGNMHDLDLSITYLEEALSIYSEMASQRLKTTLNLGDALQNKFEHSGRIEDLEMAISHHRHAVASIPKDHPSHASALLSLGNTITMRYQHLGLPEDLEEGLKYYRLSLKSAHPTEYLRCKCMNNVGLALEARFQLYGDRKDIEEAVSLNNQALTIFPVHHGDRAMLLGNLGSELLDLFGVSNDRVHLDEAIQHLHDALSEPARQPDHSTYYMTLFNLGNAMLTRFGISKEPSDISAAIDLFGKAHSILPSEHPSQTQMKQALASCYLRRGDEGDLPFELLEAASNHPTATSRSRLTATMNWIEAAEEYRHISLVSAYSCALVCLQRCLLVHPSVELQQKLLTEMPKYLANDAGASAIDRDDVEKAVELIELGRAVLWSQLSRYRQPLDELRGVDEDLANKFETLSTTLEFMATISESDWTRTAASSDRWKWDERYSLPRDGRMHEQRILLEKWNTVVEEIRALEGFNDFLRAVSFSRLSEASCGGPVIIVNISVKRCDAIVVFHSSLPIVIPLRSVNVDYISNLNKSLEEALVLDLADLKADAQRLGVEVRQLWKTRLDTIRTTLRMLWRDFVNPIVDRIKAAGFMERSRIWWCPTAGASSLPLHAAGRYLKSQKDLPDLYISSYTPTLMSLISSRNPIKTRSDSLSILAIGIPDESIQSADDEIQRINLYSENLTTLIGEDADFTSVVTALKLHPWAHIACHGFTDRQHPFQSAFQLCNDNLLSVLDIAKERHKNAELAFLSACYTAAIDVGGTPDEVIHLAAAVQFSGFRSVVGTLWEILDSDAPDLADDFYRYMLRNGGDNANFKDSAEALNIAINNMRNKPAVTPDRWIQIIHIGA